MSIIVPKLGGRFSRVKVLLSLTQKPVVRMARLPANGAELPKWQARGRPEALKNKIRADSAEETGEGERKQRRMPHSKGIRLAERLGNKKEH